MSRHNLKSFGYDRTYVYFFTQFSDLDLLQSNTRSQPVTEKGLEEKLSTNHFNCYVKCCLGVDHLAKDFQK